MGWRLRKELRDVLIPSLPMTGLLLVLSWRAESPVLPLLGFGLLCFLLAVRPLQVEVDRGTLGMLLAQPISRSRLWWEKQTVLAFVLFANGGLLFATSMAVRQDRQTTAFLWLLPLVAIASTPGLYLVIKDGLLAVCAAWALVLIGYGLMALLGSWMPLSPFAEEWVLGVYSLLIGLWSHRVFQKFEFTGAVPAGIFDRNSLFGRSGTAFASPLRALLHKELQLQRSVLLLSTFVLTAWLVTLGFTPTIPPTGPSQDLLLARLTVAHGILAHLAIFVLPLLAGANTVSTERQIGVLGWQLATPISLRRQWMIKGASTLLIALGIGVASAMIFLQLPGERGLRLVYLEWLQRMPSAQAGIAVILLALLGCAVGLFGSRHGKTPLTSISFALLAGGVLHFLWQLLGFTVYMVYTWWMKARWLSPTAIAWMYLALALLAACMLWKPSQEEWLHGRKIRQSGLLLVMIGALFGVQIFALHGAAVQLEREITLSNERISQATAERSLAEDLLLTSSDFETYAATLQPIIKYGLNLAWKDQHIPGGFWVQDDMVTRPFDRNWWKMSSVTPAMRVAARYDGVNLSNGSTSRWFWEMDFFFAIRNAEEGIAYRPGHQWHWRGYPGTQWYSMATFYGREKRLDLLDLRVRQALMEKALEVLPDLETSPDTNWTVLQPLIDHSPLRGWTRHE